jgi:SAM-dependent methyltransferase
MIDLATTPMRPSRQRLISGGQSSPLYLSDVPIAILREYARAPLSLIDVGCGLGDQMRKIRGALPGSFKRVEGIDWSPATVRHHANTGIYDQVSLADSSLLPFAGQAFDVALSMENLEHLYSGQPVHAIAELARVAQLIIITVPTPRMVVNSGWLAHEMDEARKDELPLPADQYRCLESTVHKSSLRPSSMVAAGFVQISATPEHGYYCGLSTRIDPSKIQCLGIEEIPADGPDHRGRYLRLLQSSLALKSRLSAAWPETF